VSEHDEGIERIARELKRAVPVSPDLDRRVMARVLAEARPARARTRWLGMGLAAAAALAGVLILTRPGRRPAGVAFSLVAPRAASVAVVGDFNDWNPKATPLARTRSGTWEVRVPLGPGQYNYAFVVNGSNWVPDPRAPKVAVDDFGSPNSVITVAGASL